MPEAIGVAILVPLFYCNLNPLRLGAPGKDVPVAAVAEIMLEPYEEISGLSHPTHCHPIIESGPVIGKT